MSTNTPAADPSDSGTDPRKDSLIEYPSDFPIKVLGLNQEGFVHAVTAIAKEHDPFGGTNHAIKVAKHFGIPCFNIRKQEDVDAMSVFVESLTK